MAQVFFFLIYLGFLSVYPLLCFIGVRVFLFCVFCFTLKVQFLCVFTLPALLFWFPLISLMFCTCPSFSCPLSCIRVLVLPSVFVSFLQFMVTIFGIWMDFVFVLEPCLVFLCKFCLLFC